MKIASFEVADAAGARLGIVAEDHVVPLGDFGADAPGDMTGLIRAWGSWRDRLAVTPAAARRIPLASVRLCPPVANPGKIVAIGLNYADHIAETGREPPEHQVWFNKLPNTLNGPFDAIEAPLVSTALDYEVELVVVIGTRGRHIPIARAADHVFGYMVGNDVTVRDWQRRTPQWLLGKSFDTHAPMGPWITTADAIGDPHRLAIRCRVNGEIRQHSNTRALVFGVWDQIAHLSKAMTLEPGDLIFTGTPGGVGWAMQPPRVLVAGDTVRCEIEELGAIENVVVDEAPPVD